MDLEKAMRQESRQLELPLEDRGEAPKVEGSGEANPKAPPPQTAAFWAVVDSGRAPEDAELAGVLDQLGNPDAVTLAMLVSKIREHMGVGFYDDLADWLEDRKNNRQIRVWDRTGWRLSAMCPPGMTAPRTVVGRSATGGSWSTHAATCPSGTGLWPPNASLKRVGHDTVGT